VNEKTKAGKETGKQEDEHEDQKNLLTLSAEGVQCSKTVR